MLSFATIAPVGVTPPVGAAPVGQGFNLNGPDLRFILKQIKIAEQHAATATVSNPCGTLLGSGPDQIPNIGQGVELPWGLRTVDGSCNNLIAGQEHFGTADQIFPRIAPINLRDAEMGTSYTQNVGTVVDSQPRVISNLIVDQTATNPAAVAAAGEDPEITPSGAFFIPNVAPDVGLSAPYNSWFTLFGQFFDHGLDLVNKGGVGTVFVPLQSDDPLFVPGSPTNFMVLSRATHDGDHEGNNQTSPFVDQSQTYTSHPSHQVFLRRYVNNAAGRPVSNGELITAAGVGGMATWTDVKAQAASLLGIALSDEDALRIPLLATDPYGRFIPGPNGFPQLVTAGGLVEGNPASPVSAAGAFASGHAFLDDIAHHAVPGGGKVPDGDPGTVDDLDPATYDDEMLGAHFMAGDGRVNENIGLTAVHHIFHSEHNRLVEDIKSVITTEDPIEYYHEHKKSVVNQREIGTDVPDFAEGLRRALRQDPDVILVGEMRDLETIESAIRAAETGHLVFGTLHTTGAAKTIDRVIDAFPVTQQNQVRVQLSTALIAVLSQVLLGRIDTKGMVAAYEFLVVTPAISNLIRENKTFRIDSAIQTGKKFGMQLLDDHLWTLYEKGWISVEDMIDKCRSQPSMIEKIKRAGQSIGRIELDSEDVDTKES